MRSRKLERCVALLFLVLIVAPCWAAAEQAPAVAGSSGPVAAPVAPTLAAQPGIKTPAGGRQPSDAPVLAAGAAVAREKGAKEAGLPAPGADPSAGGYSTGLVTFPAFPTTLDEALERALRSNPDLLVARANLQAAQSQLNKVRLEVVRDVSQAFRTQQDMKQAAKLAEKNYKEHAVDLKSMTDAKISEAESEAKLRYLLGMGTAGDQGISLGVSVSGSVPHGQLGLGLGRPLSLIRGTRLIERPVLDPDKLAYGKLLQTPVTVSFTDAEISQICSYFQDSCKLNVVVSPEVASLKIHAFSVAKQPLSRVLQMMVDGAGGGICVLFRDYGVFVTTVEGAQTIAAPSIPADVPLYGTVTGGLTVEASKTGAASRGGKGF